jgi:hypothetical protein
MSKINIRSPYFITVDTNDTTSAVLDLYIYTGTRVATMDAITYSLESDAYNGKVVFEISQLIGDYLDVNFNGVNESQVLWVNYQITESINSVAQTPNAVVQSVAFDGYGFFDDGANPQLSDRVLQSNSKIITLNGESWYIPIQQDELTQIDLKNNGTIIETQTFTPTTESSDVIRYVGYSANNYIFEDTNNYLFENFNNFIFSDGDADEVLITYSDASTESITIDSIDECKYTPYRLTFINKFGALQSVWMFKRSDLKMQIESEKYRSFLYDGSNYDISQHQYRNLGVSAKQSISLSSGFYPEEHNKVFEQLLLSEKIWLDYEGNILPVNIKSKEMSYKTRLNDKLIDYKFEFDFAFDKINQVY